MEICRHAIRVHHECVDSQGHPVHGDQVCFYEAASQLCGLRADAVRTQPLAMSGKDLAAGE